MIDLKTFRMRRQKDELGRYKIEVIEGFGFDKNPKKVIFWLMAPSVEDYKIFHPILTRRIAKEFGCKAEEVHFSYQTGDIDE